MQTNEVVSVAKEVLEDHRRKVVKFVATRKRFEPWFQSEIFRRLRSRNPNRHIEMERPYDGTQEFCDLWLEDGGQETWVELKCCVTNYMQQFTVSSTKQNITNEISAIIYDADKLRRVTQLAICQVLFIAYPMPDDYRSKPEWSAHLQKLRGAAIDLSEAFVFPVQKSGKTAMIVGYQGNI